MNIFFYFEKSTGAIRLYGSLKKLFEQEQVELKLNTMYSKRDLSEEDYEDELCRIGRRVVQRSKQNIIE